MGIGKRRASPDEIETSVLKLLCPMIGKFPDQPPLAIPDGHGIGAAIFRPEPKFRRISDRLGPMPAFQQGLARHAAAQDAQPAHLLGALNHGGL